MISYQLQVFVVIQIFCIDVHIIYKQWQFYLFLPNLYTFNVLFLFCFLQLKLLVHCSKGVVRGDILFYSWFQLESFKFFTIKYNISCRVFLQIFFIKLRKVHSIHSLLRIFITNEYWIFSNVFLCVSLYDHVILKYQSRLEYLGENATYLWYMIYIYLHLVVEVFYSSYPTCCEFISHCDSDLHFLNNLVSNKCVYWSFVNFWRIVFRLLSLS